MISLRSALPPSKHPSPTGMTSLQSALVLPSSRRERRKGAPRRVSQSGVSVHRRSYVGTRRRTDLWLRADSRRTTASTPVKTALRSPLRLLLRDGGETRWMSTHPRRRHPAFPSHPRPRRTRPHANTPTRKHAHAQTRPRAPAPSPEPPRRHRRESQ